MRVVIFAPLLPLSKIRLKQELPLVLLIVLPCNTKSASSLDTLATNADLIVGASQDGIDVARATFDTLGNNDDLIAGASQDGIAQARASLDTFANNTGTVAGASQLKNIGAVI